MGDFSTSALSNRTMSAFPLSIGTSLAFESIFQPMQAPYDPERPIPQKVDIGNYEVFWVNLMTLYRNIMGALTKDGAQAVMAQDLSDTLSFECDLIQRLVKEESMGKCAVIFYSSNYKDLAKAHPYAVLRTATTEKQRQYNSLMELTLGDFYKQHVKSDSIQHFQRLLQAKKQQRGLIMTHFAYDLLAYRQFERLDLIESHTGIIKSRGVWFTKFASKGQEGMPFNSMTLQVYGDSQTFAPQPQKLRQDLSALAEKYKWHPMTTRERILFSLEQWEDPFTRKTLRDMLNET